MNTLYNESVFLSFLGGIFTWFLAAIILFIKQDQKRNLGRRLLQEKSNENREMGDIETKLDETVEYKKPDITQMLASCGLQPLLIVAFANLLTETSYLEVIGLFSLLIIVLLHEFVWEEKYAFRWGYLVMVILFWITFYFLITVKTNQAEERIHSRSNTVVNHQVDSLRR